MTDLKYYTILTDKGVQYESECISTQTEFHLKEIAIGDGNGSEVIPDKTQTSLVNEIKRYEIIGEECDNETGLYYAIIQLPANDGGFTIRELGGYNADGELVMVSNYPPTTKKEQSEGDIRRIFIRMDLSIVNEKTYPTTINSDLAFPSTEYVNNKVETVNQDISELKAFKDSLLGLIYPIGALYIGTQDSCPIEKLFKSKWELIEGDRVLQSSSSEHNAGELIEAGLPNITGRMGNTDGSSSSATGCFYRHGSSGKLQNKDGAKDPNIYFDASRSSSVYGNSETVQPPAYVVNIWQRVE